ncbi:hypothetical protein [Aquimarina sp. MMG016]|uniref:hypothetical protein n=1 Tax=Aquimarina sp. MMG016 TaxID=2822690 RepID=UPI001B3A332E|nr:hypothetical protein [Aquimarina sp. MMG016]MBQ4818587.1 hypothetical protein [Aquimarina sp. MMG016]
MASKNNNDGSNLRNADTVICESLQVVKSDMKTAESMYDANEILRQSKRAARRYKVCGLDKAEESHGVYQDILSCVTIGSYKKTQIIQSNVDEYITKDDEIETLIKDTSKLLNEMRVKIEDAHNAACAMSNCFENKILPKTGKSTKDGEKADVHGDLHDILQKTKDLNEKGQNAFESAVAIAGVQTFTNTHSLKEFATNLATAMKNFKDTVESNIASTSTEVVQCRGELTTIEEELAQIVCDKKAEGVKKEGLEGVKDFVCEGKYSCDLLNVCSEVVNCYDSDYGGYDVRKKHRHQHRQTKDKD